MIPHLSKRRFFLLAVILLGVTVTTVSAAPAHPPTVRVVRTARSGQILVTSKGMTLYYFTRDLPNRSRCTGACARTWHPYLLPVGMKAPVKPTSFPGELSACPRGSRRQITYQKQPLYTYTRDTKPGEARGEKVGNVWFVAKVKV